MGDKQRYQQLMQPSFMMLPYWLLGHCAQSLRRGPSRYAALQAEGFSKLCLSLMDLAFLYSARYCQ